MKNVNGVRTSAISTFANITRENHRNLIGIETQKREIEEKLIQSETEDDQRFLEYELMKFIEKGDKYAAIVIVFAALTIEAYIYDYAARSFSDTFSKNYIDKLDPISKWVIIPRLVTGKALPTDHKWFELLDRLFKQRNNLIHYKSSSPPVETGKAIEYFKKKQMDSALFYKTATEAIELFNLLGSELKKIDPDEALWLEILNPSIDNNQFHLLEEP